MSNPLSPSLSNAEQAAPASGLLTRRAPVVLYTTRYCGYCVRAVRLLEERGVAFEQISVDSDHDARAWLVEATGQRTVPQIFIHGRSIGGFTELAALDRRGELAALLDAAP